MAAIELIGESAGPEKELGTLAFMIQGDEIDGCTTKSVCSDFPTCSGFASLDVESDSEGLVIVTGGFVTGRCGFEDSSGKFVVKFFVFIAESIFIDAECIGLAVESIVVIVGRIVVLVAVVVGVMGEESKDEAGCCDGTVQGFGVEEICLLTAAVRFIHSILEKKR